MFPDDPGDESIRSTVHGWKLHRWLSFFPHVPDQKRLEKSIPYNFQPGQIVNEIYRYLENLYIPLPLSSTRPPPAHHTLLSRPNLIGVKIRTLVNLRNAEIFQVPIGQIETET